MRGLLLLVFILYSCSSQAQLYDVKASFQAINPGPQIIHLKKNHVKVPSGGHLQGIQALSDSQIVITASSSSYSYYLTANRTELTSIRKLSDDPLRHAGGCQIYDRSLAVGVEDNQDKNRSEIIFVTFGEPLPLASDRTVLYRTGEFKRSTAGAVGLTWMASRQYIAVADWDSRNIDFYISPHDDKSFDSLTTFHAPDNHRWPSYQSINLLTDTAGKIYLIGFALDGLKNRADLYEVDLTTPSQLKLISTRNFHCKGGAGFRYGSGIYIKEGQLFIYSIARNVTARTTVNIFRK